MLDVQFHRGEGIFDFVCNLLGEVSPGALSLTARSTALTLCWCAQISFLSTPYQWRGGRKRIRASPRRTPCCSPSSRRVPAGDGVRRRAQSRCRGWHRRPTLTVRVRRSAYTWLAQSRMALGTLGELEAAWTTPQDYSHVAGSAVTLHSSNYELHYEESAHSEYLTTCYELHAAS